VGIGGAGASGAEKGTHVAAALNLPLIVLFEQQRAMRCRSSDSKALFRDDHHRTNAVLTVGSKCAGRSKRVVGRWTAIGPQRNMNLPRQRVAPLGGVSSPPWRQAVMFGLATHGPSVGLTPRLLAWGNGLKEALVTAAWTRRRAIDGPGLGTNYRLPVAPVVPDKHS
jgi:hypothetical protein